MTLKLCTPFLFLCFVPLWAWCHVSALRLEFKDHSALVFSTNGVTMQSENQSLQATVRPVRIEVFNGTNSTPLYAGYTSVTREAGKIVALAELAIDSAKLTVRDVWSATEGSVRLARRLAVEGDSDKAFLSAVEFEFAGHTRQQTEYFVPGMIYGSTEHLTTNAIGGIDLYEKGDGHLWIREDRMPAPLMAFRFKEDRSFSILDLKPDGRTTLEDAHDVGAHTLIDENLRFGSLFAEQAGDTLKTGFAFPGTEGEFTYQGNTYPGGQLHQWRRRYHPLKDGLIQEYTVGFHADEYSSFQQFYSAEYRLAFEKLNPQVNHQDIEQARSSMLAMLPDLAVRKAGKVGLSNWYDAIDPTDRLVDDKAVFGFTGKNLEVAYYLLRGGSSDIAYEIIASFLDLGVSPPVGEGYYFENGKPALAIPDHHHIYLRSYGDGMKALAKAYQFEQANGKEHPEWLAWMSAFGEWVLTQQGEDGGFPRAWKPSTGEVSVASPASSYNIVPFLCEMYRITGDEKWLAAAVKTGEFSWNSGHSDGRFVGGTIDNPDVLDKEAGTLSIEAYLELHETTGDAKWLDRAEVAARFAETWIYIWDVPMVANDTETMWTEGVSTVGLQLISTGHSLVDNYMAFDVDEYARLYKHTGDRHYFDVAKLLLHNTKSMLALPGRPFKYRAPGWIQEHWSLAPPRGRGLHPGWLPWVTTSNLNGMYETEAFDPKLYEELKK